MFNFLKEKLKKAFDKFKKVDESLESEQKSSREEVKEVKKEVKEIKKQEKKLRKKKETLRKKENKLKKEEKRLENKEKAAEREQKEEIKEKIDEKQEDIQEIREIISEIKEEIKGEIEEEKERWSLLGKIKQKLLTATLTEEAFEELFEPVELTLIENNFSIKIVEKLKQRLKKELVNKPFKKGEAEQKTKEALMQVIKESIKEPFDLVQKVKEKEEKPFVIVFFGINGAGKTTTIAKVTNLLQKNKLKCVLAAADTFRAASIEQLQKHADNLKVKVIKHDYGADPAAVAFDAIKHAQAKGIDAVLIDTAGRMHTKADLMKEMEKICRVAKPDLKIFVGEAITGSDLLEQLDKFNSSVGIDAAILTKADVDEKGGAMISVGEVTGKPIIYLGTGQDYDDLQKPDKEKIISSIF